MPGRKYRNNSRLVQTKLCFVSTFCLVNVPELEEPIECHKIRLVFVKLQTSCAHGITSPYCLFLTVSNLAIEIKMEIHPDDTFLKTGKL